MGRKIEIPYVELRKPFLGSVVIEQIPGTRCYVERGTLSRFHWWLRDMRKMYQAEGTIPLQWVADLVGVSRSAVHKRVKTGGLTVFTYQVVEATRTFLGGWREKDSRNHYDYAILSECEAWREAVIEEADYEEGGE